MVVIVFHDMHDNHKLESCYSHENKQFHDFSMTFWEIFTFQDFSMTAIFPGFSMTGGTLFECWSWCWRMSEDIQSWEQGNTVQGMLSKQAYSLQG